MPAADNPGRKKYLENYLYLILLHEYIVNLYFGLLQFNIISNKLIDIETRCSGRRM